MAVAPDGLIYVKMASLVPQLHEAIPWQVRRFDKTGKYQATILPHPPSTDPAKATAFRLIDAGYGQMTPAHNTPLDPVLFCFGNNLHNKVVDGSLVFVDNATATLTFFKLDGSNAVKKVPMRSSPEKLKWAPWLAPQIAFSPDGKYAYYSNVANTPYEANVHPSKHDQKFPQGRVYRHDLAKAGSDPEKFYDLELPDYDKQKYWMPDAWNKCTAAYGVATDPAGNVYVCDLVNQEVIKVSADGKKLSAVKVPWPEKVIVGKEAIYVVSRFDRPRDGYVGKKLAKVAGEGQGAKIVAEMTLKGSLGHSIALDETGEKPALWLGGGDQLVRVEDRGTELVAGENILNPKDAIGFVCSGDTDVEAELVYITSGMGPVWRYNGETGEGGLLPIKACDLAIGPDGMIYCWGDTGSYQGPIARYFRDMKPAPLASTGKHTYGAVFGRYGRGNNAPGMDVDWQGRVYATCGFNDCHIRVYDAEGKLVEYDRRKVVGEKTKEEVPVFVQFILDQGGNIRLDPAGNAYLLEIGLPKGFTPPRGFEKEPSYMRCSGTIYRFTPKGGTFRQTNDGWEAEGAVRHYSFPSGPISGSWASTISVCHCMRPRYDVDAYGRLYIPHGVTYKVTVCDNADNHILTFGGYGNWDAQGPGSAEPKPEIPLGWPIFAGASDKYIYVGDGLNHRVVRVDKVWAASGTCDIE